MGRRTFVRFLAALAFLLDRGHLLPNGRHLSLDQGHLLLDRFYRFGYHYCCLPGSAAYCPDAWCSTSPIRTWPFSVAPSSIWSLRTTMSPLSLAFLPRVSLSCAVTWPSTVPFRVTLAPSSSALTLAPLATSMLPLTRTSPSTRPSACSEPS